MGNLTTQQCECIERHVSPERLGPYRLAADGDLFRALELYQWNSLVSAAFFEILGHFEVVLRNVLHGQLTAWHVAAAGEGQWYDKPGLLDERGQRDLAIARERVAAGPREETPGKVVAELTLGFWRYLLDKRYQTALWAPALQHAFPLLPSPRRRKDVYDPIARLHRLRNRVAHHEPIHTNRLDLLHSDLLLAGDFIDTGISEWLASVSRVPSLLEARPPSS